MIKYLLVVVTSLAGFWFSGCAVPLKGGFADVEKLAADRMDKRVFWIQGAAEDVLVALKTDSLLAGELSVDAAVQIALLNNQSLQARYEEIGIAQTALVQAGLLHNPVFSTSVRFTNTPAPERNTEFGVVQSFLDLLMRPARKGVAAAQFEGSKRRVGDAVVTLAFETRRSYYTLQGSLGIVSMLKTIVEAASASAELARRQRVAGTISDLEMALQQAPHERARMALISGEATVVENRERMNRLMGLSGERTGWTLSDRLPDLPATDPVFDRAESLAVARRLDLAAMRWDIEALAQSHAITVNWRWIPLIDVGFDTEKDTDGSRVTGPSVAIQVPLFDRGQAKVAHSEAALRQAENQMKALAIDIAFEVRVARNRLEVARSIAERYRDTIIPLRERIVAESQRHFNYMLVGAYQLLQARSDEVDAYAGYMEAVRNYWVAYSDLERAVGGQLAPAGVGP